MTDNTHLLSLNERVTAITESFSIAFADRVRRLKASGQNIIGLQTGDPDFNTPAPIIEAATHAMQSGQTHYVDSRGLPALREAIAGRMATVHGAHYDPQSEVLATHGAIQAYYAALQAILNPGDNVLVPDPTWQTHANMVRLLGGTVTRIPSSPENGWLPTLDAWEAAITPRTTTIVINTPNNPTGAVASREYLSALNDLAAQHNLYIVNDEVYDSLLYDGNQHICISTFPGAKERTLVVNSLSKTYAMTGWRVGYLCAPKTIIDQALKISQHSITNLAPFVQHGAIFALTDAAMADETRKMVAAYARRRDLVMQLWRDYGPTPIKLTPPQGAFYYFIDIRELGIPSAEACERLLEEVHVAVLPGSAYGQCGEGFLRATIAASDEQIEKGFLAMFKWAEQFS